MPCLYPNDIPTTVTINKGMLRIHPNFDMTLLKVALL